MSATTRGNARIRQSIADATKARAEDPVHAGFVLAEELNGRLNLANDNIRDLRAENARLRRQVESLRATAEVRGEERFHASERDAATIKRLTVERELYRAKWDCASYKLMAAVHGWARLMERYGVESIAAVAEFWESFDTDAKYLAKRQRKNDLATELGCIDEATR